jgi:predicted O-methyltransferase YrrM
MKKSDVQFTNSMYEYMLSVSLREHQVLKELREETDTDPNAIMQIPPEQGQFMALLVKMLDARKTLEIGTYTGYSALAVALALPDDGQVVALDSHERWTNIAKRFWKRAGVEQKIELRLAPALDSLDELLNTGQAGSFDFAFIDADKVNYDSYYEKSLQLIRSGGVIALDNVFLFGSVADPDSIDEKMHGRISPTNIAVIQQLNRKILDDPRVDISMLPVADGLTLARKI